MARIDAQAALCKNFGDPTTFPVADLLAAIRKPSDRTRELVAAVRRAVAEGASKDAVASRKKDLPQVVWAATFNEKRRKDDVATYSGIVPLDFDGPDDPLALAARLAAEGIAAAAWISPSGTGVHALALLERPPPPSPSTTPHGATSQRPWLPRAWASTSPAKTRLASCSHRTAASRSAPTRSAGPSPARRSVRSPQARPASRTGWPSWSATAGGSAPTARSPAPARDPPARAAPARIAYTSRTKVAAQ